MDSYTWVLILAAWSLLLLLGLAGGDPLAAGRPGREAPAIAGVKWLTRRLRTALAGTGRPAVPARRVPPRHATESGLHAIA